MTPHPAIPPYLKHTSRSHSASSTRTTSSTRSNRSHRSDRSYRPHAQNEYIPTTTTGVVLIGTGDPGFQADLDPRDFTPPPDYPSLSSHPSPHSTKSYGATSAGEREAVDNDLIDNEEEEEEEYSNDEADWEAIRKKEAEDTNWKRARPLWIYPYLFCTTMTLGMAMAPRSEIYINLACLVHPPRDSSSVSASTTLASSLTTRAWDDISLDDSTRWGTDVDVYREYVGNATLPIGETIGGVSATTPGDKWFLKLQKDIYEWNINHHSPTVPTNPHHSRPSTRPVEDLPPGPVPQPELPSSPPPAGQDGSEEDGRDDDNDPGAPKTHGPPFHAIDPKVCKKDPGVQAAAAKLIMSLTVTLGILSALTTGFWGKMSDKIGRTRIFAAFETATFLSEINFIFVALFPYLAPGGYRFMLLSPMLDGLVGGTSCVIATAHAYISDLTPDGSRAGAFSKLAGVIMSGFATGPILGTIIIRATDNIMSPLYLNVIVHFLLPFFLIFVIPESLSIEARAHLSKKSAKELQRRQSKAALRREWEESESDPLLAPNAGDSGWSRLSMGRQTRGRKRFMGRLKRGGRRLIGFLEPLKVFRPVKKENGKRDWNLFLIAFAIGCEAMNYGVLGVKAQYMLFSYGWTSAQLGPYLSAAGFTRGFTLIVVLPLFMSQLRKRYIASSAASPAQDSSQAESSDAAIANGHETAVQLNPHAQTHLDLIVARSSFMIASTCLFICATNLSEGGFIATSLLLTLGAGSSPALNSLALAFLPTKSETGRLFGALSVLHALGTTLISPILFGELFAVTVGVYAPTVFFVAGFMPALALLASLFVRIDEGDDDEERAGRRGRKRVSIGQ